VKKRMSTHTLPRLTITLLLAVPGCTQGHDGMIAFQSNRDGNFEIYTMSAAGADQRRLTENPSNDIAPSWSRDGSRIAFASDRDGTWDIYTMRADGSDLKQLTKGAGTNTAPSWTRGGDKLLFISTRDAIYGDVYRMNADGGGTERLTADSLVKDSPLLAPDGRAVIVTVNRKGRFGIASIALSGRTVTPLTSGDHNDFSPVLSDGGGEIMFVSDRDGSLQVYSMPLAGGNQTRLTTDGVDERTPSYTATPGVILVAKKGGIYQITLPTKKESVLSFKGDYAPAWHTR
jgi:Tol biopolymer transport system component